MKLYRTKLLEKLKESLGAVLPIIGIVLFLCFTIAPVPTGILMAFIIGALMLIVGMMFFTLGAEMAMTPMGERLGTKMTQTKKLGAVVVLCFVLGFIITISEPDLQVLAEQVPSIPNYTLIIAVGVALSVALAMVRVLWGIPIMYFLIPGYVLAIGISFFIPKIFTAIAFDSGGVTTGPMTVPFIMAFGIGFSAVRSDKHAENDSFGLVALCSIGPILAVLILSSLFESHIYVVSSLFIGFIAGSIPLIIREEKDSFKEMGKGILFCLLGIVIVVGITWLNGKMGNASMNLGQFSIGMGIKLFLIGMVAISAMFLPGISGSTLLLIFGAYLPVISAVRGVLGMDLSYVPGLAFFGVGVLTGVVTVVKAIQICLEKFRPQAVYMILGMMLGSFYAILQGPTTLASPQKAMNLETFHFLAFLAGVALVVGMQVFSQKLGKNRNNS